MKKIYTLLVFVVSVNFVFAQTTSATFDVLLADALQLTLDSIVTANSVQGVSCAAYVPGHGTWIGVAGESYPSQPITADMRFNMASQSKGMMAVTLLKLEEQGLLTMDDQVNDWLPAFPFIDPAITIRQLLNQQTGLFDYINDSDVLWDSIISDYSQSWTPEELLNLFMDEPLFETGESYEYSNTNYLLAGMIIEAATGISLAEALHYFIWDDIGMDSTYYVPQEEPIGTAAHNWEYGTDYTTLPADAFNSIAFGCAGVVSTASEMVSWYKNLFEGNIITPASLQQMVSYENIYNYGFGIAGFSYLGSQGTEIDTHDGSWFGMNSLTIYDKKTHWIISVCVNARPDDPYVIADALHAVLANQLPAKTSDAAIVNINAPSANYCIDLITPELVLKNKGTSNLVTADIHYGLEGVADNLYIWTGSLATGAETIISLPAISAGANGNYKFYASAQNANGADDGYTENDAMLKQFNISDLPVIDAPYFEGFENVSELPLNWVTRDPEHFYNWGITNLSAKTGTQCLSKNNYGDGMIGFSADVETPVIDLSGIAFPELTFQVAYKTYPAYSDTLQIFISKDCGETFDSIFYMGGDDLSTGSISNIYEASETQFYLITEDLSTYANEQVILKFRNINGWSNNLFIDDVAIDATPVSLNEITENISITVSPNPVSEVASIQSNKSLLNAELIIYDITGSKVNKSYTFSGNTILLDVKEFAAGNYFFSILENTEIIAHGKFVVHR